MYFWRQLFQVMISFGGLLEECLPCFAGCLKGFDLENAFLLFCFKLLPITTRAPSFEKATIVFKKIKICKYKFPGLTNNATSWEAASPNQVGTGRPSQAWFTFPKSPNIGTEAQFVAFLSCPVSFSLCPLAGRQVELSRPSRGRGF